MFDKEIVAMVRRLKSASVLAAGDEARAVEVLRDHWQDRFAIVWDCQDVRVVDSDLDHDQCRLVIERLRDTYDSERGVSWSTLAVASEEVFGPPLDDLDSEFDDDTRTIDEAFPRPGQSLLLEDMADARAD